LEVRELLIKKGRKKMVEERLKKKIPLIGIFVLILVLWLINFAALAGSWPRCIDVCEADDVVVEAVKLQPSWGGSGTLTANVYMDLTYHRQNTYCIVVVGDWYVGGNLVVADWVSDIISYHGGSGTETDVYMGSVTLSGVGQVEFKNILVMWRVNDPGAGGCSGSCGDYWAPGQCWQSAVAIQVETDLDIIAHKFNDSNGNGVQDLGEEDLSGWTMELYGGDDCTGDLLATGVTDSNGNVIFEDLVPGTYSVKEELKSGWQVTTPPGNPSVCQSLTLT